MTARLALASTLVLLAACACSSGSRSGGGGGGGTGSGIGDAGSNSGGHGPNAPRVASPEQRAMFVFGDRKVTLQKASVAVPGAVIFLAYPDPVPPDHDGFQAALVPDKGHALQGGDAVRFAHQAGVTDPEPLAQVAAIFLGGATQVAHAADKDKSYIQGREHVADPRIDGSTLIFFVVRGSMAPTAYKVTLNLSDYTHTAQPAAP